MRKATTAALTAATLVVAGGYYGLADALDLVPGVVTVAAVDSAVQPFPATTSAQPHVPPATGLDPGAPLPDAAVLEGYIGALAADPAVAGATTGVSIIDVATGQAVADSQGSTPLTPASSNKVLTAWAALSALGGDHRLSTTAVYSAGTVTLVGGGDVLLAAGAGDPDAVIGRAGLADLARQTADNLAAQAVTSVSVALDDTLFTGPSWNPGWEAGNEQFVAPIQPIMLDVTARAETRSFPADPAMEAAQTFAAALSEAGITVEGEVARAAAPQGAGQVGVVESARLSEVLSVSLKTSDNTMTEVEGRLVALAAGHDASFDGAVEAVRDQLIADGFDLSGVTLVDGSGLALGNKVPAQLLAQIIARAAGQEGGSLGRTLLSDLPVGALDGTLDDRFVKADGAGTVRAKTGSLDQTVSLTGTVVTADGRLLAFSVIVDGFADNGLAAARLAMDTRLIKPLAACGCRG